MQGGFGFRVLGSRVEGLGRLRESWVLALADGLFDARLVGYFDVAVDMTVRDARCCRIIVDRVISSNRSLNPQS